PRRKEDRAQPTRGEAAHQGPAHVRFHRKPLPDRTSIVLTRDPDFHCDGCLVARTTDEALALAGDVEEVIVFGGAGVFKEFLPRADRIYLTEVATQVAGDTYFPPIEPRAW